MRQLAKHIVLALSLVLGATVVPGTTTTAQAQVVRIGVDIAAFPQMVAVPGYPVYYAPNVRANYFFYDGLFWVFNVDDGYWYSSSWYNGPWVVVEPDFVPQPILVVPYRYYHVRPAYWGGWAYDRPPRWDVYWGPRWVDHHRDWNHWDRNRRWTAAPLPVFQRDFPRNRYPSPDRQVTIYKERYNYKPRDVVVRDRESTIIERQSRGGERARAKADFIERGPREGQVREQQRDQRQAADRANNQQKEAVRQQDRSQRNANNQRREDLKQQDRAQRQSADQANRQRQEEQKQQDKARRESNNQAERAQRQSAVQQERAQRQANVQQNRQRQEDVRQQARQQDKAQRQSNVQANRQQDKAQRQANAQAERSQRQASAQQERAQHQASAQAQRQENAHQDRAQRQATQQERGHDAKEKGDRG
ncbi:MAG TPA: hypothetical protein VGH50_03895 [Candidatus Binatia bacterium]|jgi:hypothetical protein